MNASIPASRRPARSLFGGALALLALLAASSAADASEPWVVDAANYLPDPAWNGGLYTADAFAGNETFNYRAKKIVALDDGDVVAAAIVPPYTGGSSNAINLGLVRYDASGHRVAWPNPTAAYAFFGHQYIVYPNIADASLDDSIVDIKDMKRIGDRIFVLVDHPYAGTDDIDSRVIVFSTDGELLARDSIVGTTYPEYAGGIAVASNVQIPEVYTLAYAGTTVVQDGTERPTFRHFTINADSTLTPTSDPVYVTAGNLCDSVHDCVLNAIAAGGPTGQSPSRYYLAGGRQYSGDDWDYLVYAVRADGTAVESFSTDGAATWAVDDGGSDHDVATSVAVRRSALVGGSEQVFLSGQADRDCRAGIAVVGLDGDGDTLTGFGDFGETVFGGSTIDTASICSLDFALGSAREDTPLASVLANGMLGIAGFQRYGNGLCTGAPCAEDNYDGELAVVDTATGALASYAAYPFTDVSGGARTRHSGLWGIAATDGGTFTAAGDARYFQSAPGAADGAMQVAMLRFAFADEIFADGFDD